MFLQKILLQTNQVSTYQVTCIYDHGTHWEISSFLLTSSSNTTPRTVYCSHLFTKKTAIHLSHVTNVNGNSKANETRFSEVTNDSAGLD